MGSAIIADIVEEHGGEAAFLFQIRAVAATAAHYDRARLRELDERIEAHLDGLRVADAEGVKIAVAGLDEDEPGTVFTLAVIAAERGDPAAFAAALALAEASRDAARALVAGLAWGPFAAARSVLAPLLAPSASPPHKRIGIAACAALREDPGEAIDYAIFDDDPALKARALRAVGELGRLDLVEAVRAQLAVVEGDERRFWAAWSGALLGVEAAVPVLWSIADSGGPFAERACSLVMRRLDVREARRRIEGLGVAAPHARAAIAGAAALGDPALIPWLLGQMANPALARVAGEAFATITGATIEGSLAGTAPPDFQAGPSDDAADASVAPDRDGALRWPAEAPLRRWWSSRESGFRRGARYLGGAPLTPSTLDDDVAHANQPRRAGAAIELTLRQPGRPLTEVRARVRSSR
ncbi:MAG: TIGR02270 family protein [Byssovorax sp.]